MDLNFVKTYNHNESKISLDQLHVTKWAALQNLLHFVVQWEETTPECLKLAFLNEKICEVINSLF